MINCENSESNCWCKSEHFNCSTTKVLTKRSANFKFVKFLDCSFWIIKFYQKVIFQFFASFYNYNNLWFIDHFSAAYYAHCMISIKILSFYFRFIWILKNEYCSSVPNQDWNDSSKTGNSKVKYFGTSKPTLVTFWVDLEILKKHWKSCQNLGSKTIIFFKK